MSTTTLVTYRIGSQPRAVVYTHRWSRTGQGRRFLRRQRQRQRRLMQRSCYYTGVWPRRWDYTLWRDR